MDAIELSFRVINGRFRRQNAPSADQAIRTLNHRFRQHRLGYAFEDGLIARIDSEYLHDQSVKPALRLLNQSFLAGAQAEFLKAHEHYRIGNMKEALSECRRAFESTMKAICDKRDWDCDKNRATAQPLIRACFENGLIPAFWESEFSHLKQLLETSVPTGVNKLAAHGVGSTPTEVPPHIVSYILHMTASSVVFLADADAALP